MDGSPLGRVLKKSGYGLYSVGSAKKFLKKQGTAFSGCPPSAMGQKDSFRNSSRLMNQ
jgi:hypothetical protein